MNKLLMPLLLASASMLAQQKPQLTTPATVNTLQITNPPVQNFVIMGGNGGAWSQVSPMVTVNLATGVVTYGETYKPDEAADVFWKSMGERSPRVLQAEIDRLRLVCGKPCEHVN